MSQAGRTSRAMVNIDILIKIDKFWQALPAGEPGKSSFKEQIAPSKWKRGALSSLPCCSEDTSQTWSHGTTEIRRRSRMQHDHGFDHVSDEKGRKAASPSQFRLAAVHCGADPTKGKGRVEEKECRGMLFRGLPVGNGIVARRVTRLPYLPPYPSYSFTLIFGLLRHPFQFPSYSLKRPYARGLIIHGPLWFRSEFTLFGTAWVSINYLVPRCRFLFARFFWSLLKYRAGGSVYNKHRTYETRLEAMFGTFQQCRWTKKQDFIKSSPKDAIQLCFLCFVGLVHIEEYRLQSTILAWNSIDTFTTEHASTIFGRCRHPFIEAYVQAGGFTGAKPFIYESIEEPIWIPAEALILCTWTDTNLLVIGTKVTTYTECAPGYLSFSKSARRLIANISPK
ncbi:hypothetical protein K438DRAFT_1771404 [Mycena galopus ATCC 62051]|nr:hypothetical protein K438DRAFT_1771404 [Mycena galopus ATCC 62051]